MRIENISGYMTIFFGIFGSWGLYRQIKAIWSSKSVKSVSGAWVITSIAMFTAFLIYGAQQHSFPMQFQGWIRVAFLLPVVTGLFCFGKKESKKYVVLICMYSVLLSGMSFKAFSPALYMMFSFLGVWSSFVQAYTIWKNYSRGKVAVELQIIYLLSVICWLVYGFARNDWPLVICSAGFTISYLSTIVMWFRYPDSTT
jgi:uncharacterized protein with PQ loop repeat